MSVENVPVNVVDLYGPQSEFSDASSIKSLNYGRKLPPIKEPITLELVTSISALKKLKPCWDKLYEANKTDFKQSQSYDWNEKAFRELKLHSDNFELRVLVGRRKGQIVIIMPLVVYKTPTFTKLQFISNSQEQHSSVLMENHSARMDWLARAYVYMRTTMEWDVLFLKDVKSYSMLLFFLKNQNALCIASSSGQNFDCSISKNLKGRAFTGFIQSQAFAQETLRQIKQAYSML